MNKGFWRWKYILIFLIALNTGLMYAEGYNFVQKVEWSSARNAAQYKVEIRSKNPGAESQFFVTQNTYLEFSMPSGLYQYRVHVYDYLGRVSSVTPWHDFEILKAVKPDVISVEERISAERNSSDGLKIQVDVNSVNSDSEVVLVNTETGEEIQGSLVFEEEKIESYSSVSAVLFPEVDDGSWRLRITNPGGLSTESSVVFVGDIEEPPVQEELPPVEEEIAAVEPPVQEELPPVEEEIAAVEPEPEEPEEPEEKKPYVPAGICLNIGGGYPMPLPFGDNLLAKYSQEKLPSVSLALSVVPGINKKVRFGGEVKGTIGAAITKNEYINVTMPYGLFNLGFITQFQLVPEKLYVSAKAGGGVTLILKDIKYLQKSYLNKDPVIYGYLDAMVGTSLVWNPTPIFQLETGVDYNLCFIKEMLTHIVNPYLAVGLRL